jgi:hypothetical protein
VAAVAALGRVGLRPREADRLSREVTPIPGATRHSSSRFFAPVPLEFTQAFRTKTITAHVHSLGVYLADESYLRRNTHNGVVTVFVSDLASLYGVSQQAMRNWLRTLEAGGWIEIGGVRERQRTPWVITLAALALQSPLQREDPSRTLQKVDGHFAVGPVLDASFEQSERDPARLAPLQSALPAYETRRDETSNRRASTEQSGARRRLRMRPSCRWQVGAQRVGLVTDAVLTPHSTTAVYACRLGIYGSFVRPTLHARTLRMRSA